MGFLNFGRPSFRPRFEKIIWLVDYLLNTIKQICFIIKLKSIGQLTYSEWSVIHKIILF